MKKFVAKNIIMAICTGVSLLLSPLVLSDDTDLYLSDTVQNVRQNPKVLIIFDNSGSMGRNPIDVKEFYDPNKTYGPVQGLTSFNDKFIYFTKGGVDGVGVPVPDSPSEARRFLDAINGCDVARQSLETYGFYTGHIREYSFRGNTGRWNEIPDNNGANIEIIDCEDDVLAPTPVNAKWKNNQGAEVTVPSGYPVDGEGTRQSPIYHTNNVADSNVTWSGSLVTLYTDNYLRWWHGDNIPEVSKTPMEIFQEEISNYIRSVPNVDFGLQIFNYNDDRRNNGGRVIQGIQPTTATSKASLLNLINNEIFPETWTPLCETMYEASRYFAGKNVDFGNDRDVNPKRDRSIESGNKYISPYNRCFDDTINIFLITDGEPTWDIDADAKIRALPAGNADMSNFVVSAPNTWDRGNSMLPAMASWMYENDINTDLDNKQNVRTFTIAFGEEAQASAAALLEETARRGGGEYLYAGNSGDLTRALNEFTGSLTTGGSSLTSASVAANTVDRTQTLDNVYYGMFQPDIGPRWHGNLKKYKVVGGELKGKNGELATDLDTEQFSQNVSSYWSSGVDGDKVAEGGVVEMFTTITPSQRKIYSDLGVGSGSLLQVTEADFRTKAISGYGNRADLVNALGVVDDDAAIDEVLHWHMGVDVDDEDKDGFIDDMRPSVFGDPLHSKPVVINYGNDNIYIAVGTNQGALHMFKDNNPNSASSYVSESWAFLPKELFSNIKGLKDNFSNADKMYGVDGLITFYINDINGDGDVDVNDGETAWLFFGLRRGGDSYYALDITNPESPSKMWKLSGGASPFEELGQSWSQPKVVFSMLNVSGDTAKPTLLFGGGYDISKDNTGVGTADNSGRAVYMVDAESGNFLWSLAPSGTTTFTGTDSIPSTIGTLDSDADGLIDRLYFGDTGGNVWRVDMPGADTNKFTVFKLASLGDELSNAQDRRFFYRPTIVRTIITETIDTGLVDLNNDAIIVKQETPYDAILIGSGDRSDPVGQDTLDKYFMIKDVNIATQTFDGNTVPIPATITINDLYDYTDGPFDGLTGQAFDDKALEVSLKQGWYFSFEQSGEKSSAAGRVIKNVAYFNSYTPPEPNPNLCYVGGKAWLYAIDLALGIKKFNWSNSNSDPELVRGDKIRYIGSQFADTPTVISVPSQPGELPKVKVIANYFVHEPDLSVQTGRSSMVTTEQVN
ncbi:pilus assembly protein [Litorilituus sediminis]|uniref:rRNA (Guanine-N1)-methyltransferase n=1 Tax=Litorilituus sediminis TaxID=718192 RepID=A0A4P6P787_9GAMM|nr:PilC/PilY family type IV pilus protein [Litorilituus sediminis]QBG35342.1 rRNA (guanine-N1)-methyltransferase [Litorilituus sediminis]